MIENERQYGVTRLQLNRFRLALENLDARPVEDDVRYRLERGALESQVNELAAQIDEYDRKRFGFRAKQRWKWFWGQWWLFLVSSSCLILNGAMLTWWDFRGEWDWIFGPVLMMVGMAGIVFALVQRFSWRWGRNLPKVWKVSK